MDQVRRDGGQVGRGTLSHRKDSESRVNRKGKVAKDSIQRRHPRVLRAKNGFLAFETQPPRGWKKRELMLMLVPEWKSEKQQTSLITDNRQFAKAKTKVAKGSGSREHFTIK